LGAGLLLVAAYPLLMLAPWLHGPPRSYWGDTPSHARVAAEIARSGLPHGWLDSYVGGFPFGHHYPQLGWLLLAVQIRAGLDPAAAINLLGFCGTLAAPCVLYVALVRCGVRPAFACIGGACLCWVSPYNAFIGGYETFFSAGLLSQVVALPFCMWLVMATLKSRNRWEAPLAAWLSMASHPQVTVASLVLLCLALLASGQCAAIARGARTTAIALFAGAALYGQGLTTLDVPFGWPPGMGWRQLGFSPSRLGWWLLDGDLLDRDRPSVLTALLIAAFLILLLGARRAMNRAIAVALGASLLLGVSGGLLLAMGRPGALLLSFLQPLRVVSLIPPLAAVTVAAALEHAAAALEPALSRVRRSLARRASLALCLLGGTVACFALPSRIRYANEVSSILRRGSVSCGGDERAPPGYDRESVRAWLGQLSGGKLWYEAETDLGFCVNRDGIDLASPVPIASTGAVGAHVGVLAFAANYVDMERPDSSQRARGLGIGYVLRAAVANTAPPGWTVLHQQGSIQLLSRPAQRVDVGCIRRRWLGNAGEIRARLHHDLATPEQADALLDPDDFTAIEYAPAPLAESTPPESGCNSEGAAAHVTFEEPGMVRAEVDNRAPVDVIFRVTAFPTWQVLVDGLPVGKPALIAPGFFSVRVPPGRHVLQAEVSLMPGYGWLIALAALASSGLASLRGRHFGAAFARFPVLRLRRR
jgi:hypothetical protein